MCGHTEFARSADASHADPGALVECTFKNSRFENPRFDGPNRFRAKRNGRVRRRRRLVALGTVREKNEDATRRFGGHVRFVRPIVWMSRLCAFMARRRRRRETVLKRHANNFSGVAVRKVARVDEVDEKNVLNYEIRIDPGKMEYVFGSIVFNKHLTLAAGRRQDCPIEHIVFTF